MRLYLGSVIRGEDPAYTAETTVSGRALSTRGTGRRQLAQLLGDDQVTVPDRRTIDREVYLGGLGVSRPELIGRGASRTLWPFRGPDS